MRNLIKALEETGEWEDIGDFLLYGNPGNPKLVAIFEKAWVFEAAIEAFRSQITSPLPTSKLMDNLFICTRGIPSSACLKFIKTIKPKKLIYFGDLDPTSFFTFLALSHAKRNPKPKDKPKLKIKYVGVTLKDFQKYLSADEEYLIKIPEYEKVILNFVEKFKLPELKREIEFLKKKEKKVEIEGICRCFKIVRSRGNIYFKVQNRKMKNFENYLKAKLKI